MALHKLIQKSGWDLCLRNDTSPALLTQTQKPSEFSFVQSLLVSFKLSGTDLMLVEGLFCSSEFQPAGAAQDMANDAVWGNAHLPPGVPAPSLQVCPELCLGSLWQQGNHSESKQESRIVMGVHSSTHCCFCHPGLSTPWSTAGLPVPVLGEGRQSWAGTLPPQECHTSCPACCQPWRDTRTQALSKITKFNLPFFHLLLTFSINYLI